jgi:hypothetical protein
MPDARETALSGEIPGPYGPFADGKEGVIGSSPMEGFVVAVRCKGGGSRLRSFADADARTRARHVSPANHERY